MNNIQIVITGNNWNKKIDEDNYARETKAVFFVHSFFYAPQPDCTWRRELVMDIADLKTGEIHATRFNIEDDFTIQVDCI